MKSGQPRAFTFFILSCSLELLFITILFILASKPLNEMYVGIFVVAIFVLVWILAGFGIAFGIQYKSEERRKRNLSRVGLWGNIFQILATVGFLLYAGFIAEQ